MEHIPQPKPDDVATAGRRPATVTAAGWVMIVASVLGGVAAAVAIADNLRFTPATADPLWNSQFLENGLRFAVAVTGCGLGWWLWSGVAAARLWTFCVGGVIVFTTAIRTAGGLTRSVAFVVQGDLDFALSLLSVTAVTALTGAVALTVVLLLAGHTASAWFPVPTSPKSPVVTPLLAAVAGLLLALHLVYVVTVVLSRYPAPGDLPVYLVGRVLSVLIALTIIGIAVRGSSPLARAAAFASFGYACFIGVWVFIGSSHWFGDLASILSLGLYLALLGVGIVGLRQLFRAESTRLAVPRAGPSPTIHCR